MPVLKAGCAGSTPTRITCSDQAPKAFVHVHPKWMRLPQGNGQRFRILTTAKMAFMRPGQHNNKNRNRNRNRRHGGMGGNAGGGGNNANRVYDSNGPDVKLRGTAQTIAEKYMQLGRDAQSSGDSVMAESYFQFGDHYYRLWLAAQPAGQPIQFSRRMAEEEMEEEAGEAAPEGEEEAAAGEAASEGQDQQVIADEGAEPMAADGQSQDGQQPYQNPNQRQNRQRDFNNRDGNREGGRNFRQRWPRRNDRYQQDGNSQQADGASAEGQDRPERFERQERPERPERNDRQPANDVQADAGDNWEAPSFLKRPAPAPVEDTAAATEAPAPRPRRGRPPVAAAPDDAPQGE